MLTFLLLQVAAATLVDPDSGIRPVIVDHYGAYANLSIPHSTGYLSVVFEMEGPFSFSLDQQLQRLFDFQGFDDLHGFVEGPCDLGLQYDGRFQLSHFLSMRAPVNVIQRAVGSVHVSTDSPHDSVGILTVSTSTSPTIGPMVFESIHRTLFIPSPEAPLEEPPDMFFGPLKCLASFVSFFVAAEFSVPEMWV
jgi:hypothetical protein